MRNTRTTQEHRNELINLLRDHWEKHPEQRFGQLLSNLIDLVYGNTDPFYISDAEYIRELEKEKENANI